MNVGVDVDVDVDVDEALGKVPVNSVVCRLMTFSYLIFWHHRSFMFSQFSVEVPANLSDVTGSPETGIPNLVCVYLPLVGECQNAIINLLVFRTLWGCCKIAGSLKSYESRCRSYMQFHYVWGCFVPLMKCRWSCSGNNCKVHLIITG